MLVPFSLQDKHIHHLKSKMSELIAFLITLSIFIIIKIIFNVENSELYILSVLLVYFCHTLPRLERIEEELSWLTGSTLNRYGERKEKHFERTFYEFIAQHVVNYAWPNREIKRGMSVEEIKDFILNEIEKWKEGSDNETEELIGYIHRKVDFYFNPKSSDYAKRKKYKVCIKGYGIGYPTPKLTLVIKKGKLVRWSY